jgi:hypothetical protein
VRGQRDLDRAPRQPAYPPSLGHGNETSFPSLMCVPAGGFPAPRTRPTALVGRPRNTLTRKNRIKNEWARRDLNPHGLAASGF